MISHINDERLGEVSLQIWALANLQAQNRQQLFAVFSATSDLPSPAKQSHLSFKLARCISKRNIP